MMKCANPIWRRLLPLASVLVLAGCASFTEGPPLEDLIDQTLGRLRDRGIPDQAESVMVTFEAPPSGTFYCDLAGIFDGELSEFRLSLHSDGKFDIFPLPEQGIRYQGTWQFAPEKHQIGFHGDTQLDYAFYSQGASSLIIQFKPQPGAEAWVAFCDRAE